MAAGTCHILAAGPCGGAFIENEPGDLVIAADGGYRLCAEAGIVPDVLIGDFDSLGSEGALAARAGERISLPVEKDDTDTMAAVRVGLERGYRRFEIHAALGGDVGHELANLQTLAYVREQGAWGCLHGGKQTVYLITDGDGKVEIFARPGQRVSVLAFGGDALGVYERGMHWELDDGVLGSTRPLGVSNVATADTVVIGVEKGRLAVVVG